MAHMFRRLERWRRDDPDDWHPGEIPSPGRAMSTNNPLHASWPATVLIADDEPAAGYLLRRRPEPAVLHRHEHFDGTGHPFVLRGSAIPLAARIVAVADAFDAMTRDRPY